MINEKDPTDRLEDVLKELVEIRKVITEDSSRVQDLISQIRHETENIWHDFDWNSSDMDC